MIPLLFVQLCITEFYLGRDQSQIRIKSEVGTVKHVEALQFFFLLGLISPIVFLNVKNLAFTAYSVRVCVCWWWWGGGGGGGGGQDNITIQTSTMTPLSATVSGVSTARGVGGWGSVYKCILLSQRVLVYFVLNNNENEHRR